jgi:hypothetical protein
MTRTLTFLVLFLMAGYVIAQNTAASPYSASGLGERSFNGTQANRHMGGLDVFTDSIHVNLNNPASYGFSKVTTYSVGINYTNNNLSSSNESQNSDVASIDYISVSIPTGKFSFGFGLLPLTSVGYRVQGTNETSENETFNRYEGNGGLNQAYLSVGLPITSYFAIGSTINYNFGNLFYRTGQFLEGIDNGTFMSNESSVSGLSFQFSGQLKIPIQKKHTLQAMYSYQPTVGLDSRNSRIFSTQSLSTEILTDVVRIDLASSGLENTKLDLSSMTRIGLGYGKNKKWFFGVQYNLINSSNFANEFFKRENILYRNSEKWIVGGYFIPNYSSFTNYWSKVVYRFGFRTEQMSTIINNTPLSEKAISFGLGLPLAGYSNVNVGLEISQRGRKDLGLIKESAIALRVGMSLNDIWFIKRKYN